MIDIFTVFAVLGGIGTSMGISAPLICRVVSNVFHIPNDGRLLTAVFLLWFAIFTTSVWRGLDKGIKILSDINIYIAVLFIGIVFLLAGPGRVLDVELNSIGLYAKEFFRMSTYTDPFGKSGFPQQWTIFYWGWWLSYIPIMGLFTARISREDNPSGDTGDDRVWFPGMCIEFFGPGMLRSGPSAERKSRPGAYPEHTGQRRGGNRNPEYASICGCPFHLVLRGCNYIYGNND